MTFQSNISYVLPASLLTALQNILIFMIFQQRVAKVEMGHSTVWHYKIQTKNDQ